LTGGTREKALYLRVKELETKWEGGHIQNWSMLMNQRLVHDGLEERLQKYI